MWNTIILIWNKINLIWNTINLIWNTINLVDELEQPSSLCEIKKYWLKL